MKVFNYHSFLDIGWKLKKKHLFSPFKGNKLWSLRDFSMLYNEDHFSNWKNSAKPDGFGNICEKTLSDPYVLFSVTAAMFFNGSKISTPVLCRIPQGTFIPSLFQIGQVVPKEKSFEKLLTMTDDDGCQVMAIAHMSFGWVSWKTNKQNKTKNYVKLRLWNITYDGT